MDDFNKLLTAYGNAMFDCGHWRPVAQFIPNDDTPEWLPYQWYLEAAEKAKAELLEAIHGR